MCCEWVFVFLDTRPLALMLGPRPPSYRSSAPKILQEQIYELSILLIQDYTYSRLKHYTYSRYSKSNLERPSYGVQNKWKDFSSQ